MQLFIYLPTSETELWLARMLSWPPRQELADPDHLKRRFSSHFSVGVRSYQGVEKHQRCGTWFGQLRATTSGRSQVLSTSILGLLYLIMLSTVPVFSLELI